MTHDYTFKTYIANGREYYEYSVDALTWTEHNELERCGQSTIIKKDFPFPESLLSLLYLDVGSFEPLVKRIEKNTREFLPSNDDRYVEEVLAALDELAGIHVYFELVRLEWRWRFAELKVSGSEDCVEWLPRKRIAHIPSNVAEAQRQILDLFDHALNMDCGNEPLAERMVSYYRTYETTRHRDAPAMPFQFEQQSVCFEAVDSKTFTDVLYPNKIYDLIIFHLSECVKRETRLRVCKNCGRYFAIQGRSNAEYCNRVFDQKGRTCKEMGAIALWTKNKSCDEPFKLYRREYKNALPGSRPGRFCRRRSTPGARGPGRKNASARRGRSRWRNLAGD